MRIFLSYPSQDREQAEQMYLALRAQGHNVFFDRKDLPPGEEYDIRIRSAIEKSHLLIFLLSPDAIDAGSYTLTELEIARNTWPHPTGRVLPVMVRPVELSQIPPYLHSVTVLQPEGNVTATVADSVHRIALARRKSLLAKSVTGLSVATVIGFGVYLWTANRAPAHEIVTKDGAPAMLVPAGTFTMGDDEVSPRREIYLDAFHIDKYEVTTARYAKFAQATGLVRQPENWEDLDLARGGDLPVVGIDWQDANAYCHWAGKRLPTEAEWEKAARGTDGRAYPWGNDAPTAGRATFARTAITPYRGGLTAVGSHAAGRSPYGAHDLAGNASEWVADWHAEGFAHNDVRNPKGPERGTKKVIRGGGWQDPAERILSARRYFASTDTRGDDTGFRCAQDVR
ncbi:MAG: SUMF1/EgtB/PvdO family nonheme iron enzyme [Burkholderiales bacterium]